MHRITYRASNTVNRQIVSAVAMTTVTFQNRGEFIFYLIKTRSVNHNFAFLWNIFSDLRNQYLKFPSFKIYLQRKYNSWKWSTSMAIFQRWLYFKGDYNSNVTIFQRWLHFKGAYISRVITFQKVTIFQKWLHFKGDCISKSDYISKVIAY